MSVARPQSDDRKGEREFIRQLAQRGLVHQPVSAAAMPFGDDMAPVDAAGPWLWSSDMLMDGVDFESDRQSWRDIGRKALAVNLSDCAAMAVRPVAVLCALSLNNRLEMEDALDLMAGMAELGRQFDCPIVGGDTNSWDHPTVICVSIAGQADGELAPVRRGGARPGDRIYVSGPVGGSILGRHLSFMPRINEALAINRALRPRAMIDTSDGLALDLWRICEASGCGAVIDETELKDLIHLDAHTLAAQDGRTAVDHALRDGEDFELIVVLAPSAAAQAEQLGLRPLGEMSAEPRLAIRATSGAVTPLDPLGWEHFR